jgi:large subunit ribosomal protein L10
MNRAQKVESVADLGERFERAPIAIVTEYRGLNVAEISELRSKVKAVDGDYLVAKNTLMRIAIREHDAGALEPLLKGPNGVAFGYADAVATAKAVTEFADSHEALVVKGGVLDGALLSAEQVKQLAAMPGRDELRAQLLALFMTPATNLVRLLNAPAQQLVQVLEARRRQQES